MDASKMLKNVNNLNEYIRVSQDVAVNYKNSKIQFNMSTVLALKKVRSLEIEYFNKCEENGAAVKIFGLMLLLPPSKTWSLLGRELVSLLQYWLDALRKHLIFHNNHWWSFLQILLQYIKEIRIKDNKIISVLLEETAESLLDLATHDRPDVSQRHKMLFLFNMCGADSSREIRFALRKQLDCYFVKLSTLMVSCGDVACQYSIVETLLRWLLPRHDQTVRLEAAAKWFPSHLYNRRAVNLFLERPWQNFFKDARDFLNAHNASSDLITSVICKKLTVGKIVVISGTERRENWLDMNSETKCISMILEPGLLEILGSNYEAGSCETLVISEANTNEAKLLREATEVKITVTTLEPPKIIPSSISVMGEGSLNVEIVISSKSDMVRVDKALCGIFAGKYQVLFDVQNAAALSPQQKHDNLGFDKNYEEETRFSHPVEPRRRRHAGFIVKGKSAGPWVSPSTASTSSLAQLHEKLATLPRYNYEKETVSVCARPQLSSVTELSETDDRQSLNTSTSTFKLRPYGVCQKSNFFKKDKDIRKVIEGKKSRCKKTKCLSPAVTDEENSVSCLLVATIGSADESVINDTLERLPQSKECNADNILDLLVQEAFQNKVLKQNECKALEAERYFHEVKEKKNANIPLIEGPTSENAVDTGKNCTIISNSTTTEESNTEVVEGTQYSNVYLKRTSLLRKNIQSSKKETEMSAVKTFDEKVVEEFFSQHFAENRNGDLVISPTLAKKINDTSSETSEDFDDCGFVKKMETNTELFPDIEIVECLNFMLDKICNEFDMCTENLYQNIDVTCKEAGLQENLPTNIMKSQKCDLEYTKTPKPNDTKSVKGIKLKFRATRNSTRTTKRSNKLELLDAPKYSPITVYNRKDRTERYKNITGPTTAKRKVPNDSEIYTPLIRKKRKLYSPKDEKCNEKWDDGNQIEKFVESASNIKTYSGTNATVTCYKEIEKERNEYMKKLRNRKSKELILSPKTRKMNEVFDKLKNNIDSNEKIILAEKNNKSNDLAVYNFTSDSEDDDFKKNTEKRNSSTVDNQSIKNENKTKKTTAKRKKNNPPKSKIKVKKYCKPLIDERMREVAPDILNTSFEVLKSPENKLIKESAPIVVVEHRMEAITDNIAESIDHIENKKVNKKHKNVEKTLSLNKRKHLNKVKKETLLNDTADRTQSPLPGLVVEMVPAHEDNINDSVTASILQKFKQIYKEMPDTYDNELNATQNVLSEIEREPECNNISNITEKLNHIYNDLSQTSEQSSFKQKPLPFKIITKKSDNECNKLIAQKISSNKTLSNTNEKVALDSSNDIINISGNTEINSEKSINTLGYSPITAHGVLDLCQDDQPPSRDLLNKSIEPRNLEIDDLNKSIKDFFVNLNREIVEENDISKANHSQSKSVENNSLDIACNKNSETKRVMSPLVSVTRLSSEDIIKWLPSRPNSDSSSSCASVELSNKTKQLPAQTTFEDAKIQNVHKLSKTSNKSLDKKEFRSSQISPIKLFDDLKPITRLSSSSSKSNDYVKHVRNLFNSKKVLSRTESVQKPKSTGHYWLRSSPMVHEIELSRDCKLSTSTTIEATKASEKTAVKKNSTQTSQDSKRRKFGDNNDTPRTSDSDPSISSVNDWFKRIEPKTSKAETVDFGFKENILNVMEKLDTTLVEIHHNTNKKFINMFVDAQKQLSQLKEQRRSLYKQAATEMLTDMVKLIDVKFLELDKRSQEMDEQFMVELKERARHLIRDDCRQKRAMVTLLREDVQAVIDHINKGKRDGRL